MLIKKNSDIPLYKQIRDYLENKINSGEWEPGYQIPTEKELSSLFQVSNITVKRSILDLVNSGKLYRISGKGTFVSKQEETDLTKLVSLYNQSESDKAYPHKTLSFHIVKADQVIADNLQIEEKEEIYHIARLKLENEKPIVLENSWIPKSFMADLRQQDIENKLLYNLFLQKYGLKLKKAKVYISTKSANETEASFLNIPIGEQLLVMDRYTTTNDDKIVEYSRFIAVFKEATYYLEIDL